MRNIKNIILALLFVFSLTSCLTTKQTNLLQEGKGNISGSSDVKIEEYTIKEGDELMVRITVPVDSRKAAAMFSLFSGTGGGYGSDSGDRLRTLSVSSDGTIYFPYLGDIKVINKTVQEVQGTLEKRIKEEILTDEGCNVYVNLSNRYYSVIGESNSGRYNINKEHLTIFQALSQSRDIKPYGDRSIVKIIRETKEGTLIKTFDLRSSDVVNSEFYYIQPNDIIYIQPMKKQFFGINSFGAIFAIVSSVASLGIMIYNLTK
ncbi:polysaccharide export outer membrane protein [Dysgonomonadaceae bacterium PH5-43]|nr:polysaccharide export outer membrane protein [Dysgonomonadaceae bacterium PH5-43]